MIWCCVLSGPPKVWPPSVQGPSSCPSAQTFHTVMFHHTQNNCPTSTSVTLVMEVSQQEPTL